jgi:hypothetical protein
MFADVEEHFQGELFEFPAVLSTAFGVLVVGLGVCVRLYI